MSCEGCKGVESEVMQSATDHIKSQRKKIETDRLKIICLTTFASVVVVCAAVVACFAIYSHQQSSAKQKALPVPGPAISATVPEGMRLLYDREHKRQIEMAVKIKSMSALYRGN